MEKLFEFRPVAIDKFITIHKIEVEASLICENLIEQPLIDHTNK